MRLFPSRAALVALVAAHVLCAREAAASDRRFTYSYESGVLAPGEMEVEPWMTLRAGRHDFYAGFDTRLEVEVGLLPHVQSSVYVNLKGQGFKDADGMHEETSFEGFSNEWKIQLMDPVTSGFGLALYVETTARPVELELETKLILDKRFRNIVMALNVTAEREVELAGVDGWSHETNLEASGGLSWLITPRIALGAEVRQSTVIVDKEGWEGSTLWAGPVLSLALPRGWVAMSVMPQLVSMRAPPVWVGRDLEHNEAAQARLLMGWHL